MKKFFRFFALAAIAGSLMVACGDDEDEPENVTPSYTITKDSTSFESVANYGGDKREEGYWALYGLKDEQGTVMALAFLQATTGTFDAESSQGDYAMWRDQNDLYYDEEGILDENGEPGNYYNFYPDYESWSETISAIDFNALTVTGKWSEKAMTMEDYVEGSETYNINLSGEMENISWTWATK